ncbi:unnamed protein product [Rhizophagus irregularis]|nr:unnamed protein product [Rhizophagus irregularis]CAB5393222.1 unnamed protein product [Rhizophagus irregularis]
MKLQKQQVKTAYEEWCTMRPFAETCRYVPVSDAYIHLSKIGDIVSIVENELWDSRRTRLPGLSGNHELQRPLRENSTNNSTRDVGLSWNMCGPSQMEVSNSS